MSHKPIQINSLSLTLPHKICFEDFSTQIFYGDRIALIGRNGSGKTSLLNILSTGLPLPEDVSIAIVPQIIELKGSGGERFNRALTQAIAQEPNVLLLDEPTNHLDGHNRQSLLRMIKRYHGTLIIASHDHEVLRSCQTLWHIEHGKIHVFSGLYDDYKRELHNQRAATEHALTRLNREKKEMHDSLMKEQDRASKSRSKGEKSIRENKWPTITSHAKALRAQETSGRKRAAIDDRKQKIMDQLAGLPLTEIIAPTFSITSTDIRDEILVSIREGSIVIPTLRNIASVTPAQAGVQKNSTTSLDPRFHGDDKHHRIIANKIHLTLSSRERIAIRGNNGSGKTTLLKAIMNDPNIIKTGDWQYPKLKDIGYLDQHYHTLDPDKTVFETIQDLLPNEAHQDIRKILNQFLFRKNEEVHAPTNTLSGGEKARLCLAQISARTPKLLLLDEITNNLDLETREHVIDVLNAYPGAMIVVSHDEHFLEKIGSKGELHLKPTPH